MPTTTAEGIVVLHSIEDASHTRWGNAYPGDQLHTFHVDDSMEVIVTVTRCGYYCRERSTVGAMPDYVTRGELATVHESVCKFVRSLVEEHEQILHNFG